MSFTNDIAEFHDKFGLERSTVPSFLREDVMAFRLVCLREEIDELEEAIRSNDLAASFDAIIDLVYFALGTAHMMGLPFDEGWNRVHAANMQKVRATAPADSKRGSSFDVVKPAGWQAPNLDDLVSR